MSPCLADNTISQYLEGQLPGDGVAAVREHIDSCDACRRLLGEAAGALAGSASAVASTATGPVLALPDQVDEYRLVRPLGRGAMGQVWLAEDTLLGRLVAVKFIAGIVNTQARERLRVEARAVARLQHENVVSIYRVGEVAGCPFLVSEFVRGASLDRVPKPLLPERLLDVALGLARGLSAAHRRGVLHRDLKPANTILTEEGQVKLLDFGLAKLLLDAASMAPKGADPAPSAPPLPPPAGLDQTLPRDHRSAPDEAPPFSDAATPTLTAAGSLLGTPLYMAPEMWRGEPATRRADLYSLGAMLYELGCGVPPHKAATLGEIRRAAQERDAQPLRARAPHLDGRLCAAIDRCLRRDPEARFSSAEDLHTALTALLPKVHGEIPAGNPYRGLGTFEATHRALFCGRAREARDIIERLRAEPLVLIAGDSGVGKSSLCRAGVLPMVVEAGPEEGLGDGRAWRVFTVTPGRRPLTAILEALAPLLCGDEEDRLHLLRTEPAALPRALRQRLRQDGEKAGVLLFVDQLEELLTEDESEEAAAAAEVLGQLALQLPGVRVLGTVRGDYLVRLAALPGIEAQVAAALYILRPLSAEGLREAIVLPAERTGLSFESDALVDELAGSVAEEAGGLPLLQFALGQLWEHRDREQGVIPTAALGAIGGVAGALARHADGVVGTLLAPQRQAARRILERLVTREGTRARRREAELRAPEDEDGRVALSALVRGRLLVARDGDEGAEYEVAHEALLSGWRTLRDWLSRGQERRAAQERLHAAAAEWERLGRPREALWARRQLAESGAAALEPAELLPRDWLFLATSRRNLSRQRIQRAGLLFAAPILAVGVYGGVSLRARAQLGQRVAGYVADADRSLSRGRKQDRELAASRREAFSRFDAGDDQAGERAWARSLPLNERVLGDYAEAARALERALAVDAKRGDVRHRLAEVLYEHALAAERDHRRVQRDDLIERSANYDEAGEFRRRFEAPARLSLASTPAGAAVTVARYEDREGKRRPGPGAPLGRTPLLDRELEPGSYLLTLSLPDRPKVRYPVLLGRGERHQATLPLPAKVPPGFVYVPPGRFLYGSADPESVRNQLAAAPLHEVKTGAYLIGRTEVTFAEWLEFLRALPLSERRARRPHSSGLHGANDRGVVDLAEAADGAFTLTLQASIGRFTVGTWEPVRYPGRETHAVQDWLRLPVGGISFEDGEAYVGWLRTTGRVPGARICSEFEWERAARGADERLYPHGDRLDPSDANHDATYGRQPLAFGPSEVGSFPVSDSPFGVADLAGNVWEWTRSTASSLPVVQRGGGFYHQAADARSDNRFASERTQREIHIGLRICASQ